MSPRNLSRSRRRFLQTSAYGAALFATPGLFAEELTQTSPVGEGPFYPDSLPLDTDNDLLLINESITPAVGEITHLSGHVLTSTGQPVRLAVGHNELQAVLQERNSARVVQLQAHLAFGLEPVEPEFDRRVHLAQEHPRVDPHPESQDHHGEQVGPLEPAQIGEALVKVIKAKAK